MAKKSRKILTIYRKKNPEHARLLTAGESNEDIQLEMGRGMRLLHVVRGYRPRCFDMSREQIANLV